MEQTVNWLALTSRVAIRPVARRGTPLLIDGDKLRLEQVFQTMIGNAIMYSPTGGLITAQVTRRDAHACVMIRDQ